MPKPRQAGGVPIWVSGTTNKLVARRIVQFGSGWIPWGDAASDIGTGIAQMRELVEAAGGTLTGKAIVGNIRPVKAAAGGVDLTATMAAVPALVAAGVTDCRMAINVTDDANEAFDTYSATVEAFRAATA
jgi:hypothetical protein